MKTLVRCAPLFALLVVVASPIAQQPEERTVVGVVDSFDRGILSVATANENVTIHVLPSTTGEKDKLTVGAKVSIRCVIADVLIAKDVKIESPTESIDDDTVERRGGR